MMRVSTFVRAIAAMTLAALPGAAGEAAAGAPRENGRFCNVGAGFGEAGLSVALPFFARRVATFVSPRPGAAERVPFDRAVLESTEPTITWVGHSTMLVRLAGNTILTDPMFSDYASPVPIGGPKRLVPPGVALDEIDHVDVVTLSHNHYDHTDVASIRALAAKGARFFVPLGLGELVRSAGGVAVELDWWESATIGNLTIHCVPAQHFSRRGLFDGNRTLWSGWVVTGGGRMFYHAGDTGYFGGFREIAARLGPVDLAALPIGAYEPAAMMHTVHLDPEEAVQAAVDLSAVHALAMHYGTFDLTDEPLDEPPKRFAAESRRRALADDRTWILRIGETRSW